jgi:hypothetical protein
MSDIDLKRIIKITKRSNIIFKEIWLCNNVIVVNDCYFLFLRNVRRIGDYNAWAMYAKDKSIDRLKVTERILGEL